MCIIEKPKRVFDNIGVTSNFNRQTHFSLKYNENLISLSFMNKRKPGKNLLEF